MAVQKTLGGVAGAMTTGAVGAGIASMPSSTSLAMPPMAPLSGIVGGPAMPMAMHHHPAGLELNVFALACEFVRPLTVDMNR